MTAIFRPAIVLLLILTAITGVAYPLLVTGIAQIAFPSQANGSLLVRDGKVVGSSLIGQSFSDPKHFWSRPSATAPQPYNGLASGGSNLGPINPALTDGIKELKLHRSRRGSFLNQNVQTATENFQRYNVGAEIRFVAAQNWSHFLFFALIGAIFSKT